MQMIFKHLQATIILPIKEDEMRYDSPKYEIILLETENILAASSERFEIQENEDGSGNVIMNAFDLFG